MSPKPNTWSAPLRSLSLDLGFGGTPSPSGGAFSTLLSQAAGGQGADAMELVWGHSLTGMALHLPENVGDLTVYFEV